MSKRPENDPLRTLLITEGTQMDKTLVVHLRRTLTSIVEQWLSDEIESGKWLPEEYPYNGPQTCFLMASAAITVLQAIYDAETDLVREGFLDADNAILPR